MRNSFFALHIIFGSQFWADFWKYCFPCSTQKAARGKSTYDVIFNQWVLDQASNRACVHASTDFVNVSACRSGGTSFRNGRENGLKTRRSESGNAGANLLILDALRLPIQRDGHFPADLAMFQARRQNRATQSSNSRSLPPLLFTNHGPLSYFMYIYGCSISPAVHQLRHHWQGIASRWFSSQIRVVYVRHLTWKFTVNSHHRLGPPDSSGRCVQPGSQDRLDQFCRARLRPVCHQSFPGPAHQCL